MLSGTSKILLWREIPASNAYKRERANVFGLRQTTPFSKRSFP